MIGLSQLGASLIRGILESRGGMEPAFSSGEILHGQVIRTMGGERAVVMLRGFELVAVTSQPLSAGQALVVRVEQSAPRLVVSLLPNDASPSEKTAALLRMYLSSAAPLGKALENLREALDSLPRSALKGSGAEKIMDELGKALKGEPDRGKNILDLLGLSMEAELAGGKPARNLKASLLIVRRNLESLAEKEPEKYGDALKKVTGTINNIELRQLMNSSERQEVKTWEIPFWNGHEVSSARLHVTREKQGKGTQKNDEAVRFTLMTEMSGLGFIRTEALALKKNMDVRIYAETDSAVTALNRSLKELSEALAGAGFVANLSVEKATGEYLRREPEEKPHLPAKGILNVKA